MILSAKNASFTDFISGLNPWIKINSPIAAMLDKKVKTLKMTWTFCLLSYKRWFNQEMILLLKLLIDMFIEKPVLGCFFEKAVFIYRYNAGKFAYETAAQIGKRRK